MTVVAIQPQKMTVIKPESIVSSTNKPNCVNIFEPLTTKTTLNTTNKIGPMIVFTI